MVLLSFNFQYKPKVAYKRLFVIITTLYGMFDET
jgi:hypothetical protein